MVVVYLEGPYDLQWVQCPLVVLHYELELLVALFDFLINVFFELVKDIYLTRELHSIHSQLAHSHLDADLLHDTILLDLVNLFEQKVLPVG